MQPSVIDDGGASTLASRVRQLMISVRSKFKSISGCPDAASMWRSSAWTLNFCGLFIFFASLCALESKIDSRATGMLWWTLLFHSAVCALWLARCYGSTSAMKADIEPFRYISATLLMVSCDRAVQLQSAQVCQLSLHKVDLTLHQPGRPYMILQIAESAANGTLAGAIITLLGYLPLLVDPMSTSGEQTSQQPARSQKSRSHRLHDTGSHLPDMSVMEQGLSGAITESGMPSFKSYSNPYAVEEDPGMETIQPALMPNVCLKNEIDVGRRHALIEAYAPLPSC